MRTIDLEELKKIELDILSSFHEICECNNLTYSLDGGTLIGAVRHKGFIPWDDDIDVCMPRSDYEALKKVIDGDERYALLDADEDDYYYGFGKLVDKRTVLIEHDVPYCPKRLGVNIDIFPIDGLPNDQISLEEHFEKIQKIKKMIILKGAQGVKLRKNILLWIKDFTIWRKIRHVSLDALKKEYYQCVTKYDFANGEFVIDAGSIYGKRDIIPRECFAGITKLVFENREFNAMNNYDAYLKHYYDDYMALPPEEKRISHHHFSAYWK